MSALALWCFRHRLTVAGAWASVLLALGGFVAVSGTSFVDAFSLPHTDSTKALDLLTTTMPGQSGDRDAIVLHVNSGTVRDQAVQQRVAPMLDRVAHLPSIALVASPYGSQGAAQVSKDGRTAYASVLFDARPTRFRSATSRVSSTRLRRLTETGSRSSSVVRRSSQSASPPPRTPS